MGPIISVGKITLNKTVYIGELTEFRIKVSNDGDCNLSGVYVVEYIPDGLKFVEFKDESGLWTYNESSRTFYYNGILERDDSLEFVVVFNATRAGNFTNVVHAGSNVTNESVANNTTEALDVRMDIQKVTLNETVFTGQETGFVIVVSNTGLKDLTDVRLKEIYPDGLVYSRFIDDSGKWFNRGDYWIYNGVLAVGESTNFTVIFNTTKSGTFNNTIIVSSNETGPKNTSNTTKVVVANVTVAKITLNETVMSGEQTSFDIVVTNDGIYNLTGVVVTDAFPEGLAYSGFVDASGKWIFDDSKGNAWI